MVDELHRQTMNSSRILFSAAARPPRGPRTPPVHVSHLPQVDAPARWQRGAQLLGAVSALGTAVYLVLFHDFNGDLQPGQREREHVFMPLRRAFKRALDDVLTLPEERPPPTSSAPSPSSASTPSTAPVAAAKDDAASKQQPKRLV